MNKYVKLLMEDLGVEVGEQSSIKFTIMLNNCLIVGGVISLDDTEYTSVSLYNDIEERIDIAINDSYK